MLRAKSRLARFSGFRRSLKSPERLAVLEKPFDVVYLITENRSYICKIRVEPRSLVTMLNQYESILNLYESRPEILIENS